MDELREEADRNQAELAVAERDWKEWVIARNRVGEVLAPTDGGVAGLGSSEDLRDPGEPEMRPEAPDAAKPKSVVADVALRAGLVGIFGGRGFPRERGQAIARHW
ncbi:hypothetical protein ACGF07_32875 [Kitasatospora sp. NPDC048194]|uniref:hypothetical protein n=1 Tax=Kitasatospora sp. NPDC048194 TaxID=3364045 RepID=UPI00371768D7